MAREEAQASLCAEGEEVRFLNATPLRVYQTASAAPGTRRTDLSGPSGITVAPGGSLTLTWTTAPDAPLNLVSEGLGAFPNGLTAISLRSDAQGVVTTTWTAIPGTDGDVVVVAASPLASGQARCHITVE